MKSLKSFRNHISNVMRNRSGQTWPIVMLLFAIFVFALMYFMLHAVLDPLFTIALSQTWIPMIGNALGWWVNILAYLGIIMIFVFIVYIITNSKKGPYEQ
jgi:hypothetical protein